MFEILVFALAGLAIFFGGLIKGAVGLGAPLVAVPVLAALYDVRTAIVVMTVPLIVSNLWQIWLYRAESAGRAALWRLLAGCVAGVVVGTFLLGVLPEAWLALSLGLLLFLYLGLSVGRPSFVLSAARARAASLPVGLLTGTLQGAAGLSTPVGATFLHAQRLGRDEQVFAMSAMFLTLSATQMLALSGAGMMGWRDVLLSVAALVPIMAGVWLGQYLGTRISARAFEILTLLTILAVALGLLARALPGILF